VPVVVADEPESTRVNRRDDNPSAIALYPSGKAGSALKHWPKHGNGILPASSEIALVFFVSLLVVPAFSSWGRSKNG